MKKTVNHSTAVIILNSLSVLFIILTLIAFLWVASITAAINQANYDRFELTCNANQFMNGSAYLTNEVRAFAATGNMEHYDNYWNEVNTLKNREIGVANMKAIGITAEEQGKIDAMMSLSNDLVPLESDAMELAKQGKHDQAIESVYGAQYKQHAADIKTIRDDFLAMLDTRTAQEIQTLTVRESRLQVISIILVIAVAVLQFLNIVNVLIRMISPIKKIQQEMEEIERGNLSSHFSLTPDTSEIGRLIHSIIATKAELQKYIGDISHQLGQLSEGNLDIEINIDYIGDFAPIKSALEKIVRSLNGTMSQIQTAAQQVSTGSSQVADGAQLLARGSTEQASAVQQLSELIEDVAKQSTQNAEMAQQAAQMSRTIKDNAEQGARHMDHMMQAVKEINDASNAISRVITVIDDIAFQTNILALNAAVEAARAGQHGKGFAVVADEVRNLAAKSADAAKDTGELISTSVEKARLGFDLATETVDSLQKIVKDIEQSVEMITRINEASTGQTSSILQINQGIDQVSQVVHQNSAAAEQSAASAQEMSSQSVMLEQQVALFKLKGGHSAYAVSPGLEYSPMGPTGFSMGSEKY